MATHRGPADRLRPPEAQGGRALHPRPGPATSTTSQLPGMLHGAVLRSPVAHARIVSIDTSAAAAAPQGPGRHHRQGPRGARARVDADAVRGHAGRARHRQGALPGPGGRVRRRRRPLRRARRARADRRRVRACCPRSSTPARRSTPTPRSSATTSRARPTTTSSTGSRATARRPTRCSRTPTSSSPRTCSTRASHPAPMETCGVDRRHGPGRRQAHALRAPRRRRTRTARSTRSSPGCPSTRSA